MQKITQKPWLYKTELCKSFSATEKCSYGDRCQYAHGQAQLRAVTRHPKYKSRRCKNFDLGSCSYGSRCCFLHSDPKKGKYSGQRHKKSQHHKKGNHQHHTKHPHGSSHKQSGKGRVTRLRERNLRNRVVELEASKPLMNAAQLNNSTRLRERNLRNRVAELEASKPLMNAAQLNNSSRLMSSWSPTPSKSPQLMGFETRAELLPIIHGPKNHQRKQFKPHGFSFDPQDSQVQVVLEGIGINTFAADAYHAKVNRAPVHPEQSLVADAYRAKGNRSPVHPEQSITSVSPEADVSWEEANRGRLSVFKHIGNKSRSCRW